MELAVGHVEGDHRGGAALEQAVGEAAGGGAHVERAPAGRVDPERVERVGELHAPARDVRRRLGHRHVGLVGHQLARLLAGRPPTRTSPAITAAAARERDLVQAALGEQGVEPPLGHARESICDGPHTSLGGRRSLEWDEFNAVISHALRPALLWRRQRPDRVPFLLGLDAAPLVTGVLVGSLAIALGLAGTEPGARGSLPLSAQAVYDRGLALGLFLSAACSPCPASSRRMALFAVAGIAALIMTSVTRYSARAP